MMITSKQITANQNNAQLSTGAVTEEGKVTVSKNAIKHGIFTKDIVIHDGEGQENEQEYAELLENLIQSLAPQDQLESLLVEKIAVDYWRLRRVIRYETGEIRRLIDTIVADYYDKKNTYSGRKCHRSTDELNQEIKKNQSFIKWGNAYIKCLSNGEVRFDKPVWKGRELESKIDDDLYVVINKLKYQILDENTRNRFENEELNFEEKKSVLQDAGYTDGDISKVLIECVVEQNEEYREKIAELEGKKSKNQYSEQVLPMINSLPTRLSAEKVMRYEKSIQKSILQNLVLLKNLQAQ